MAAAKKPSAVFQWWLDKRNDLQTKLALARKNGNARDLSRLQNGIERINVMLESMKRELPKRS